MASAMTSNRAISFISTFSDEICSSCSGTSISCSDMTPPPPPYYDQQYPMITTAPVKSAVRASSVSSLSSSSSSSSGSSSFPSQQRQEAPLGSSSFIPLDCAALFPTSPLGPMHLADPSSPSKTIQVICKLFPKSALAKKIRQVEEEGEGKGKASVDEKLEKRCEAAQKLDRKMARGKKEKKIAALKMRDQMMADEFGRMGL